MKDKSGLQCAIEHAGSQTKLAKLIGVKQPTISAWLALDDRRRKPTNPESAVAEVIRLAGGQEKLATTMGVLQQTVSEWLRKGYMPLKRAIEAEMNYGVSRTKLLNPRLLSAIDTGSEL